VRHRACNQKSGKIHVAGRQRHSSARLDAQLPERPSLWFEKKLLPKQSWKILLWGSMKKPSSHTSRNKRRNDY
jgi:hypothetical protein